MLQGYLWDYCMFLRHKISSNGDNCEQIIAVIVNSARIRRLNAYGAVKAINSEKIQKPYLYCVK